MGQGQTMDQGITSLTGIAGQAQGQVRQVDLRIEVAPQQDLLLRQEEAARQHDLLPALREIMVQ